MTNPAKIRACAWVPADLRDQWEAVFGEYGSLSWLMETAMREMLAATSNYPSKEAIVRTAIREHVSKLATDRQAAQSKEPNTTR